MKARALLVVAGCVLGALVLAAAATSTTPKIASHAPQLGLESSHHAVRPQRVPKVQPVQRPTSSDRDAPTAVSVVFAVVLGAAVAAFVGFVIARAIQALRNRPRLVLRRERADWDDVEVHDPGLDPVAARVTADAEAQQAALTRGSARNGIVECWIRLETAIADAGIARRPSDTSTELTERVLGEYAVDAVAIEELSTLYREARFSTHPMGEAERAAAVTALGAVHDGLRAGVADAALAVAEPAHARDTA